MCGVENLTPHKGNDASRSVNRVRHPRGSYLVTPIVVSRVATPENKENSLALLSIRKEVGTRCRSPSHERCLEGCSPPFMLLPGHLTALRAWRLVQAMSVWLVKTRRAPSRHSRDASAYGHTTTAMHKRSALLPFRISLLPPQRYSTPAVRRRRCHPVTDGKFPTFYLD